MTRQVSSATGSETPAPPNRLVQLSVTFFDTLNVAETNDHAEETVEDCVEEARRYIEKNGLWNFVNDWNLSDFDVYVGNHAVALSGRVVPPAVGKRKETK